MSRARRHSFSGVPQPNTVVPPPTPLGRRADTDLNARHLSSDLNQREDAVLPSGRLHRPGHRQRRTPENSNTRWKAKNILTCDGGGIRGYATVLLLDALMKQIGKQEREYTPPHHTSFSLCERDDQDEDNDGSFGSNYLPCHYFDYMFGTSTGGLIAVMLSRWRMTTAECLEQYEDLGPQVFGHRRKFSVLGFPHDKHHKAPLIRVINGIVDLKTPESHRKLDSKFLRFPAPPDLCRTALLANSETDHGAFKTPYIFRSYTIGVDEGRPAPRNHTDSIDHHIWEVCRATTAAPSFFKPQAIGGILYSDAGVGTNNPAYEAFDEFHKIHNEYPTSFVSLGTGKPVGGSKSLEAAKKSRIFLKAFDVINALAKNAKTALTDCENTHRIMTDTAGRERNFQYHRFNVEEGLGKMKIDECKPTTLTTIRRCTEAELAKPEVKQRLKDVATDLVKERRNRIENYPDHWERFACCTRYECMDEDCIGVHRERVSLWTRDAMATHLRANHFVGGEGLHEFNERLSRCRKPPQFPVGPW